MTNRLARRTSRAIGAWPFAALLLMAAPLTALAEHEADHRYVVRGYVLDAERRPLAGRTVSIRQMGSATTGSDGAYSIRMHLHNEDLGRELEIRSGGVEQTIRVSFDPSDSHTARVFHANFVGGEFVTGELEGVGWRTWQLAAAGAGVVALGAVALLRLRRRVRRRKAVPAEPPPGHAKPRPRKSAKKKRKR